MLTIIVIKESTISACHYLGNKIYKFIGDDLSRVWHSQPSEPSIEFGRRKGPRLRGGRERRKCFKEDSLDARARTAARLARKSRVPCWFHICYHFTFRQKV